MFHDINYFHTDNKCLLSKQVYLENKFTEFSFFSLATSCDFFNILTENK